jgi:hypothetical protein
MNVHLYHARYSGGPCDGMAVVSTRDGGEDTWSMPVAMPSEQAGSDGRSTTEFFQAVYKLRRTCHLIDQTTPTIRYEYEFVGLEVVAPVARTVLSGWLEFLKSRLKCWFQPNLWLPRPEGRPKRPGQAVRLPTCPGPGLGRDTNRASVSGLAVNRDCASRLNVFQPESCVNH